MKLISISKVRSGGMDFKFYAYECEDGRLFDVEMSSEFDGGKRRITVACEGFDEASSAFLSASELLKHAATLATLATIAVKEPEEGL